MTKEQYELARVRHGDDVACWPAPERAAAEAFLASAEGARLVEGELALDGLFVAARAANPDDAGADAFLDRLLDIPGMNAQAALTQAGFFTPLSALVADLRAMFSPLGLASQGVAFALVLAVGVFVGLQGGADTQETMDLSTTLFASGADFYFEGQ